MSWLQGPRQIKVIRVRDTDPPRPMARGPWRFLLWAIPRDAPATLEGTPASVPCLLGEDSHSPGSTCFHPRPDDGLFQGSPSSGRREGGAAGRGRAAMRLRPLRGASRGAGVPGAPRGLGPCHRVLPRRARTAPDPGRLSGPLQQPLALGSPLCGPPTSPTPTPVVSSPKRLWSWRVPCTVPLGKISRWKPVRQ